MPVERFSANAIVQLLHRQRIACMEEIKSALGTSVDMTVFRKLGTLAYLSSYSHGGRYYTLRNLAQFDQRGLWTFRGVHFSRFGSLVETVEALVDRSARGYLAAELSDELQVQAKGALLHLIRLGRLCRKEVGGRYVYCSVKRARGRHQLLNRQRPVQTGRAFAASRDASADSNEAKAALVLFASLLDEKQRRLFGGLESLRLGWGGDREVAAAIGLDPHTVAKGRRQLLEHDVALDRQRRPGGGRARIEKKHRRSSSRSKD
jgi:hypothetical protein